MSHTEDMLIIYSIFLLSGSGFLIWPVCALLWRGKKRTSALRWVFLAQSAGNSILVGFALLSNTKLEYRDWLTVLIVSNLLFTPLVLGAAIYDFAYNIRWAHISPSEWRDTLDRLKHDYSNRLTDPNLSASKRADLERLLKELQKLIGRKSCRG